jgi:hypothetical protein
MLGVALAVAGAFLAANILAEYEMQGYVPWAGALAFGVLVGEAIGTAGRWTGWPAAAVGAVIAFAGFAYAGRLETDGGVEPYAATTWIAAVVAAGIAAYRLRPVAAVRED